MPNINLTCHTEECPNDGFTIIFTDPADLVICGGCHREITDKTPADTKES
jgi:ribosomal protein S27E